MGASTPGQLIFPTVMATLGIRNSGPNPCFVALSGNLEAGFNVTNATWLAGTATITTDRNHGYAPADLVFIQGVSPSGFNSDFNTSPFCTTITGVGAANQFNFALAANPGTFVNTVPSGVVNRILFPANSVGNGRFQLQTNESINLDNVSVQLITLRTDVAGSATVEAVGLQRGILGQGAT